MITPILPDLPYLDRRLDFPLPFALGDVVHVPELDALVSAGAHKPSEWNSLKIWWLELLKTPLLKTQMTLK